MKKIRIAFIKFGGLGAGSTERWLQMMAANLPKNQFEIDYYYCDAAPYIESNYQHANTDPDRIKYMQQHHINLIKFNVAAKDLTTPTHNWLDTNFWNIFDEKKYDIVQSAKAGPKEYPYYLINLPISDRIALDEGSDPSPNIAWSTHPSEWQRTEWIKKGGSFEKSSVIATPAEPPASCKNLRRILKIPTNSIVAGFHQRVDDNTFSTIPLQAFSQLNNSNWHFVIMGGSNKYQEQASKLKLKNIHFIDHSGNSIQISKFLNSLDIFSHGRKDGETFGTVLAEAMMHGLPCLSHWSPIANAQPETMGPAGLFALNSKDYTNKLKLLFSNSSLRNKLASKAKPHAQEYYSLQNCVQQLANIYYKICNKQKITPISTSISNSTLIPYHQSHLGFLCAKQLEKQKSFIKQTIPEEFNTHVIRFFLPHISTFLDIGSNTGKYGFIAANECKHKISVYLLTNQKNLFKTTQKTIYLNNWENKVFIYPINSILTENKIEKSNIEKIDCVNINTQNLTIQTIEKILNLISKHKSILILQTQNRKTNQKQATKWLTKHDYIIFQTTKNCHLLKTNSIDILKNNITYYCLHQQKHDQYVKKIHKWTKQYRIQKRKEQFIKFVDTYKNFMRYPRKTICKIFKHAN